MDRPSDASWRLKLRRAQHHLQDVDQCVQAFADGHPYEAIRNTHGHPKRQPWHYDLRFTSQPDEMLPVIVGDVIHNLRSALDHLIVGIVPNNRRRKAGFPIFNECPFDDGGNLKDSEVGKSWSKLTTGIPVEAMTQIKLLQPYEPADTDVIEFCRKNGLNPADINGLAMLGRFDNADKHRELVTVASGVDDPTVIITVGDQRQEHVLAGFHEDRAELIRVNFEPTPASDSEVEVEVNGTVSVGLEVRRERGISQIPSSLKRLIEHVEAICTVITELAER